MQRGLGFLAYIEVEVVLLKKKRRVPRVVRNMATGEPSPNMFST